MESYIFKTKDDITGFFQKENDTCHLYIDEPYFPSRLSNNWSQWQEYVDAGYPI